MKGELEKKCRAREADYRADRMMHATRKLKCMRLYSPG